MSSFQGSRLDEVFLIAFLTKGAFIVSKQLPWARWCLSNQWQAQKMPTGYNLKRWGYAKCHRCGPPCNNSEHIMTCSGINCTNENLRTLEEIAKTKLPTTDGPGLVQQEQDCVMCRIGTHNLLCYALACLTTTPWGTLHVRKCNHFSVFCRTR